MRGNRYFIMTTAVLFFLTAQCIRAAGEDLGCHSPEEIVEALKVIVKDNRDHARLHVLGETRGGREIVLLELGPDDSDTPAVLVAANMTGDCPLASEAALELAHLLAGQWREEIGRTRWYIIAVGNPDGYSSYFGKPFGGRFVNARPLNDDNDEAADEDGPEDLNGDGYITLMRQVHPEGEWMEAEGNPVLMRKADAARGERGKYRLITEGIDNDGDGRINEDAPGGVDPGRNFPHEFEHYTATGGQWAASEPESRALLGFAFDHPEIAMVLTFGRSNNLRKVPESSKKAETAKDKYKVPKRLADRMGLDPNEEYPLKDLVEMAREYTGYKDLDENMVLTFLGVGAAVNPDRKDLPYWNEISKRYNDFMKEAGLEGDRLEPPESPPGSLEEWAYFQYGTPGFSMDFWTLPVKKKEGKEQSGMLSPDEVEKMSNEEFVGLGREKIEEFLAESGAPAQFSADMVITALERGMITTKKIAGFMRKGKKEDDGVDETDQALYDFNKEAFLEWQPYEHPTLGRVEIGGRIPYSDLAPPPGEIEQLLAKQLPFVRELAGFLPRIAIDRVEIEQMGSDIWRVDAWVVNNGFLPYPTHQGQRCKRPTPVAVTIGGRGFDLLEGRERVVPGLLEGSGGFKKVSWLVRAEAGIILELEARSFSAGRDRKTLELAKGGGE